MLMMIMVIIVIVERPQEVLEDPAGHLLALLPRRFVREAEVDAIRRSGRRSPFIKCLAKLRQQWEYYRTICDTCANYPKYPSRHGLNALLRSTVDFSSYQLPTRNLIFVGGVLMVVIAVKPPHGV
jgi:hypothetical protein